MHQCPIVVVVALAYAVPASAQSLADAAAKEATRRAAIAKPTKVYTERDIAGESVPAVVAASQAPNIDVIPSKKAIAIDAKDEVYWKDRMRALKLKLAEDLDRGEAATRHFLSISSMLARADFATRVGLSPEVARAAADSRQWVATVNADRRQIVELEEEARRAGVPPGWLRIR